MLPSRHPARSLARRVARHTARAVVRPLAAGVAALALAGADAGAQVSARFYDRNFQGGVDQPTLEGGFAGTPVCRRTLAAIAFTSFASLPGCSGLGDPPNSGFTFGARFTGVFRAAAAGSYTFDFTADDGVALYVDGRSVFSRWFDQSGGFRASVTLAEGDNAFVLDYYANTFGTSFLTVTPPEGVTYRRPGTVVPEPGTVALLATGLGLLAGASLRRRDGRDRRDRRTVG